MTSTRLTFWAIAVMVAAHVSWSHAQPPPSANELVVEAGRLILSAERAATPEQAISLLEEAQRKLELITEVHPSSDMAVKLATGQGIGTVSLAGVQAAIKATTAKCWTSLSLICVLRLISDATPEGFASPSLSLEIYLPVVVAAQAAAGQFSAAVETAELFNGWRRQQALLEVAVRQRKAGQAEEAQLLMDKVIAAAAAIEDARSRAEALDQIAVAQAEAGQFSAAVETAASIDNLSERTKALLAVAVIQQKAGNVEDARTTASRAADAARAIRDPYNRAPALGDVAATYIEMGDRQSARATIDTAAAGVSDVYAYHQALTLTTVAAAQTKAGNIREARANIRQAAEVAKSIQDSNQRTGRLKAIVSVGVDAEQFIEAAQVAELLTDPYDRARALVDVALAQAKAGRVEPARVTIEMAADFAESSDEPFERTHARALVANVQTTIGDITDRTTTDMVVEAAQSLDTAYERTRVFAAASLAQSEAGHIDAAGRPSNWLTTPPRGSMIP